MLDARKPRLHPIRHGISCGSLHRGLISRIGDGIFSSSEQSNDTSRLIGLAGSFCIVFHLLTLVYVKKNTKYHSYFALLEPLGFEYLDWVALFRSEGYTFPQRLLILFLP